MSNALLDSTVFLPLITALSIGLLIGLERGWRDRDDPDGSRVAGIRTFGLIGFLGGLLASISSNNDLILAAGFLGVAILLREGLSGQIDATKEVSITTMIAALLTYALGAIAVHNSTQIAAAGAVLTALVLWLRPSLHALLNRIDEKEVSALLRWLLITLVVLPVLPNEAYGPHNSLNPRTIWWMVVIISGLGFLGYIGLKYLGTRRGTGLLAITGGMVSSTAVTLSLAKLAREGAADASNLTGGTLIAWAIMLFRTIVVVAVLAPNILQMTIIPLGLMLVTSSFSALFFLLRPRLADPIAINLPNPLDLLSALKFAALLAGAMLASKVASEIFGEAGLYAASIFAGAVDIDAVSLSLAGHTKLGLSAQTLAMSISLAACANTALKTCIATIFGRGNYTRFMLLSGLGLLLAGAIGIMLTSPIT